MSVEDAVTEGLAPPMDPNARAAEEAKRMLAELDGEATSTDKPGDTNGARKADIAMEDAGKESSTATKEESASKREDDNDAEAEARERRQDRRQDRRPDHDRQDSNGRGRGRGGRDGFRGGGRGGGRGRGDRDGYKPRNFRDNIKSNLTTQEVTDDPDAIRKQVHFYFSDSNLPKDKHLFGLTGGLENKPVRIEELLKFKRMQRFQPVEAIVDALKESTEVELAEDDTAVRRKYPLPDDYFEAIATKSDPRTVYVKGFGEESADTQFDIETFFDPYGPTKQVRLRRNDEKLFKGSVFVEFDTEERAEAFLALDPKPKYKDRDLQIMGKKDYQEKKSDDLKAGRITSNHDGRSRGRGGHDRRGSDNHEKRNRDRDDDRDWRERRNEDQKRGFRDDDRQGDRDRGRRGGKPSWTGGGRSRAPDTDERGIPKIKPATAETDAARDDALAKAKAAVAEEMKKERDEANNAGSTEQNGAAVGEATAGKKRAREEDDDAEAEREIKKVDTKTEDEPIKADS